MLKAVYEERGPVPEDVIHAVEEPTPSPGPGEVLIEVLAAPINPSDVLTLTGDYGMLPPLPAVGGNEGVGRVAALGDGAEGVSEGDVVLLPVGSGTWVSHMVTDPRKLIPLPAGADPVQLSMITVNPPTASLLLSEFVDLQDGDWVIQNGANSGVGGYLVQLAAQRGIRTVNVVRRESAAAAVKDAGGDVVLVDGDDLAERVAEATGGADIRLAIDAIGGAATDHLADCLTEEGTLVNYGMMSGEPCMVSPKSIVFRDVRVRGFWLAKWFRNAGRDRQKALFGELTAMIAQGKLKARVHGTYDVADIKQAVAEANAGGREGKVLVCPRHDG